MLFTFHEAWFDIYCRYLSHYKMIFINNLKQLKAIITQNQFSMCRHCHYSFSDFIAAINFDRYQSSSF